MAGGCVGQGNWGQAGWPDTQRLGQAAITAAKSPQTWVPVLAAGALQIGNVDERWSEDLATDQPLFGGDAKGRSNDLRDVTTAAYVLTALFAESESAADKLRGIGVGVATMIADGVVSQSFKNITSRQRPDGSNDESLPSGHASKAASRANMAIRNLQHMNLADWQRHSATWALHGVAAATGLARVEAAKHHLSDVLVGYALGHFVSTFMYEAFMHGSDSGAQISFVPVERGGALTVTVPLRRRPN